MNAQFFRKKFTLQYLKTDFLLNLTSSMLFATAKLNLYHWISLSMYISIQ